MRLNLHFPPTLLLWENKKRVHQYFRLFWEFFFPCDGKVAAAVTAAATATEAAATATRAAATAGRFLQILSYLDCLRFGILILRLLKILC